MFVCVIVCEYVCLCALVCMRLRFRLLGWFVGSSVRSLFVVCMCGYLFIVFCACVLVRLYVRVFDGLFVELFVWLLL